EPRREVGRDRPRRLGRVELQVSGDAHAIGRGAERDEALTVLLRARADRGEASERPRQPGAEPAVARQRAVGDPTRDDYHGHAPALAGGDPDRPELRLHEPQPPRGGAAPTP